MAKRKIYCITDNYENMFLHKKSKEVDSFDAKLEELIIDMKDTLRSANGAGLSAVQVGTLKRVFIADIDGSYMVFVNPKILSSSGKNKILDEGCLSVPEAYAKVERPNKVVVKAKDEKGSEFIKEFSGFNAKIICHENDHLDGILYIDKISIKDLKQIKGK